MSPPAARTSRTRVSLRVLGQERDFALPVPEGPATVLDLLPTARALSAQSTELGLARAAAQGEVVSCKAGCGACCRQLVPISGVEAVALARAVAQLPAEPQAAMRARFGAAVRALENAGLLDRHAPPGRTSLQSRAADVREGWGEVATRYLSLRLPCPVLVNERCALYDDRPLVCREFFVTSPPSLCEVLGAASAVPRPILGSEALATATRQLLEAPLPMLPLVLALEWSEVHGAELEVVTDGDNLVNHLVAAIDELGG